MSKKHLIAAMLLCVVALVCVGCGEDNPLDPEETIVFENRTGMNGMNCYIDSALKGTVNNGEDLKVEGDYEGDRYLSVNVGGLVASRSVHVDNGMTFIYEITR